MQSCFSQSVLKNRTLELRTHSSHIMEWKLHHAQQVFIPDILSVWCSLRNINEFMGAFPKFKMYDEEYNGQN